ncbi:MAG: 5-oxoprolinase subunit PxpB [Pseudomonadota bacterium]
MSRIARLSDDAFSMETSSPTAAQSAAEALRGETGVIDAVPGMESIVVIFDALSVPPETIRARLEAVATTAETPPERSPLTIPVRYGGDDGPDLAAIAEALGFSEDEVVRRHQESDHRVDMMGFTPGFAYVGGLHPSLAVGRRETPRVRLAAGSIGIAGGQTGIYALDGPGGWKIIGRTEASLFDPQADEPFAATPGRRIRFVKAS